MPNSPQKTVDDYLAAVPGQARATLEKIRQMIRSIVPEATEAISYGAPAFKYKGRPLAAYAAYKDHCSYFPMSPAVLEAHRDALKSYKTSKGAIRFPIDQPLPAGLVEKLVQTRMAEIEAAGRKARATG